MNAGPMKIKETLNASDVGLYTFCPKAWDFRRQGYAPCNREALIRGAQYHEAVGRRLRFSQVIQAVLIVLIIAVILLLLLKGGIL